MFFWKKKENEYFNENSCPSGYTKSGDGYWLKGGVLQGSGSNINVDKCSQLCNQKQDCISFHVWHGGYRDHCYLYTKTNGSPTGGSPRATACTKNCPSGYTTAGDGYWSDWASGWNGKNSFNIKGLGGPNLDPNQCAERCNQHSECVAFHVWKPEKHCYLYTKTNGTPSGGAPNALACTRNTVPSSPEPSPPPPPEPSPPPPPEPSPPKLIEFPMVEEVMKRESQNNIYLPNVSNNPIEDRKMYYRNYNIDNLPDSNNDLVDLVQSKPVMVQSFSEGSNPFLSVTNTQVFKVGDLIVINPNGDNIETNYVIGKGNNILRLQNPLVNDHLPNEPVYNKYNQNLNSSNIPAQQIGYAKIVDNKNI